MANITICDLCKLRIPKGDKINTLVLSYFQKINLTEYNLLKKEAEICMGCSSGILKKLDSEDVSEVHSTSIKKTADDSTSESRESSDDFGAPKKIPLGDAKDVELLDKEVGRVPSAVDLSKGSKAAEKLNRRIEKERGACEHPFKSLAESGGYFCSDAPSNVKGPLAGFKGCSERLSERELG